MNSKEIVITIDVDWAPEAMIEDTLQLLDDYDVTATIFCTHKSDVLLSQKKHELGIHPNFVPLIDGNSTKTKEQIVDELLEIYPDSKGVRAHGLVQSSGILNMYIDKGLKYDSNLLLPYQPIDKWVYDSYQNFKRNIYNFEDDLVYKLKRELMFNPLDFRDSKKIVFDFHPFLIYNNISSNEEYEEKKKDYKNVNKLLQSRDLNKTGIRNIFIDVLEYCHENATKPLKDYIL